MSAQAAPTPPWEQPQPAAAPMTDPHARAEAETLIAEANRMRREAESTLTDARSQATETLTQARSQADAALADAHSQARTLIASAQDDSETRRREQERESRSRRRAALIDVWSPRIALAATIGLTASGEYALAKLAGWSKELAWMLPVAIDVYVIQAIRRQRDVYLALGLMLATNVVYHLADHNLLGITPTGEPHWGLIAGVAAIAPLVMWRVHVITHHSHDESSESPPAGESETPAPSEGAAVAPTESAPDETPNTTTPTPTPATPPTPRLPAHAESESPAPAYTTPPTPTPTPHNQTPAAPAAPTPTPSESTTLAPAGDSTPTQEQPKRPTPSRERKPARVAPISGVQHEIDQLLTLMRERGGPRTVELPEAETITGRPQSTAARRLKAARERYESEQEEQKS